MSDLPKGWVEEPLSEVCELITDGTHHSPSNGAVGEFKYVTAKNIRKHGLDLSNITYVDAATHREIYKRCPVKPGDVLYIKDGATTGLAIVNPLEEEFSMLSSVALLRPAGVLLNAHFLRHQLNSRSLRERMTGDMTGSAIRRLTLTTIGRQEVAVPPLAEQKRIVAKLDALNAKSARARTELARIETLVSRYKQAVLSKAFSGDYGGLAERKRLGDATHILSGYAFSSADYVRTGIALVRIGDIVDGVVSLNDGTKRLPAEYLEIYPRFLLQHGDICIALSGATTGKLGIFSANEPALLNQRVVVLRSQSDADQRYVALFAQFISDQMLAAAYGGAQPNISPKWLSDQLIPWPSSEQRHSIRKRIESAFAKIDRLAKEAKRALELVGRLDEAILAKAFRGELVPQDENDEPAKRLLARIRAERAAAPKGKRGRGAKG